MRESKNTEYLKILQHQKRLYNYWLSNKGIYILKTLHEKFSSKTDIPVMKKYLLSILTSESFFWSATILDVICEAASSIPSRWILTPDYLPATHGFFWLDKPIVINHSHPSILRNASDDDLSAIGTTREEALKLADIAEEVEKAGGNKIRAIGWSITDDNKYIAISYFNETTDLKVAFPFDWSIFTFGASLADMGSIERKKSCRRDWGFADFGSDVSFNTSIEDNKINLFATMLTFLQQKILAPVCQIPPRQYRRKAEREERKIPTINIIKLREIIHHGEEGEHRDVEWTCQWLVRGHWRDQWYRSLQRNQPIWIAPHIKGPPDKPFKGAPRLFTVVR